MAKLIVETGMDNKGFKAAYERLKKEVSKVTSQIGNTVGQLSGAFDKAFDSKGIEKQTKAIENESAAIVKQQNLVEQLKDKYDRLMSGEEKPSDVISLEKELSAAQKELVKAQKEYDELERKMISVKQMASMDLTAYGDISPENQRELSTLEQQLDALGVRMGELDDKALSASESIKQIQLNPTTSEEVKKVSGDYDVATKKLDEMKNKSNQVRKAAPSAMKETSKATKKTTKDITGLTKSVNTTLKRIKDLLVSVLIFNVLRSVFKNLRDYIGLALNQNTEFAHSLAVVKGNLATAFQPILQTVIPIITRLMNILGTATRYLAQFTTALFGKTVKASQDAAKGMDALANSTKNAGKEANKSLASFDEINQLQNNSENSGGDSDEIAAAYEDIAEPDLSPIKRAFETFLSWYQKNFSPIIGNIWSRLEPQLKRMGNNFKKVWSDLSSLGSPLLSWFNNEFTIYLQTLVASWGEIIVGLFDTFNMVFEDIWNKVLFPFLESFTTTILPLLTRFKTELVNVGGSIFTEAKRIFDAIWKDALAPALEMATTLWVDFWGILSGLWDQYGAPIFDGVKETVRNIGSIFMNLWNSFLKPVFDNLFGVIGKLWDEHLKPLVKNIGEFVAEFVLFAQVIYNKFIAPIVNWLVKTFGPTFTTIFNSVVNTIGAVVGTIAGIINSLIGFFKGIIQFLKGVFTGDWNSAFNGIKSSFKGFVNTISGFIEGLINGIIGIFNKLIGGVNSAIGLINKIPGVEIPKIPNIPRASIPRLATGTVVPANNGEFTAVLGDNRNEPEIVSPMSAMKQSFIDALSESGIGQQGGDIYLQVDGTTFAQIINPYLDREKGRVGMKLSNRLVNG